MENVANISDAGLYTDFSELARLRNKASTQSSAATKEVAKQFESLFLQMMLKSMRDATAVGESSESDQTQFYQEMFDKQIALDLSKNEKGYGLGLAKLLEKEMTGGIHQASEALTETPDFELLHNQINRSTSSILTKDNGEKE